MNQRKRIVVQGSMKSRIFTLCIGIAVLLATADMSLGRQLEKGTTVDESEKAAMRELREIAQGAAMLLNVYMDARVTDLLACSRTSERLRVALTTPEARTDANRTLETLSNTYGAYDAIMLIDKNGVCVAATPEQFVNRDCSGDSAFKGAMKGNLTFSDFHKSDALIALDPKSRGWTIAIAVPVKVGEEVEGVLMSYLKWSRLDELIAGIMVGKTGYVYVLNRQNQVLIHPSRRLYGVGLRDRQINLPKLDDAVKKKVANFSYDFVNAITRKTDTKFVGFAYPSGCGNFPGLGWTVGAGADQSEIVALQSFWLRLLRLATGK